MNNYGYLWRAYVALFDGENLKKEYVLIHTVCKTIADALAVFDSFVCSTSSIEKIERRPDAELLKWVKTE